MEARKRCDLATREPWELWEGHAAIVAGPSLENTPTTISGHRGGICDLDGMCIDEDELTELPEEDLTPDEKIYLNRMNDATFMTHARTDLPAALDTLEKAMTALATLESGWAEGHFYTVSHEQDCQCFYCGVRRLLRSWNS
jgi:hypothetical protein